MKAITIHTDGGCHPNPGPGGWAAVIQFPSGEIKELSGRIDQTTNNRMELLACIMALLHVPWCSRVELFTDSQYVQKGITVWIKGWKRRNWGLSERFGKPSKAVKNKDLWLQLDEISSRHSVDWKWVRGHAGNPMNERADILVTEARSSTASTNRF